MNEDYELEESAPLFLLIITLAGGFLRVMLLGTKGIWLDEAFSLWAAHQNVAGHDGLAIGEAGNDLQHIAPRDECGLQPGEAAPVHRRADGNEGRVQNDGAPAQRFATLYLLSKITRRCSIGNTFLLQTKRHDGRRGNRHDNQ